MSDGKGILLKVDTIADKFVDEVKATLASRKGKARLVGILATVSAPSRFYADFTRKQCEALGIEYTLKKVGSAEDPALADGEGVEEAIIDANGDDTVDGIMVYYPIFGTVQDHYLQQVVSPLKDVEGLHFRFHYNMYHNIRYLKPQSLLKNTTDSAASAAPIGAEMPPPGMVKSILPCTPLAVVKCLEAIGVYNRVLPYGDRAYGKTVTVINRSEVVGRPLAALLSNDGARVFSVDIESIQEYTKRTPMGSSGRSYRPHHAVHPSNMTLQECLALSDVVVSAVPSAHYKVKTEWLKEGCVCVNVAADKNFEKDVREKAAIYIPAVGKMTILMLLRNLLNLQSYKAVLDNHASPA